MKVPVLLPLKFVFFLKAILPNYCNNPNLARQRHTNIQHSIFSMDPSGKLVYTHNHESTTSSLETPNLFLNPGPPPKYSPHPYFTPSRSTADSSQQQAKVNTSYILLQLGETKVLETVSRSLGHLTRIHMLFWRVKSNLKYLRERPGTEMKGSGSWSVCMAGHCLAPEVLAL